MKAALGLAIAALLLVACQSSPTGGAADSAATSDLTLTPAAAFLRGGSLFSQTAAFEPWITRAGGCVTDTEISAEQFIYAHTAMMVTGLTCHRAFNEPSLFNMYQAFTVTHQDRIREIQFLIGGYLGRHQYGNRDRLFDTYRTQMANEEAQLVTNLTATGYCRAQRDRFYALTEMSVEELESYLDVAVEHHRNSYQVCS